MPQTIACRPLGASDMFLSPACLSVLSCTYTIEVNSIKDFNIPHNSRVALRLNRMKEKQANHKSKKKKAVGLVLGYNEQTRDEENYSVIKALMA